MVIAHLITSLGCGGAENQLQQLVLGSNRSRFRHVVISLTQGGPISTELQAAGIEVYSLGMSRHGFSPLAMVRLLNVLKGLRPDVLQCWLYHACLMGLFASRPARIKQLIWALRSANPGFQTYSLRTRTVVRLCARLSSFPEVITVNSKKGRAVHEEWSYCTQKMRVIVNGIDAIRFCPDAQARRSIREELAIRGDSVLVGMIARYHPMKDHETFLRAAALLYRRHPHLCFLLAGEGMVPSNAALTSLIQENGLRTAVRLVGARRDIPQVTAALDISCLSSWSESFPNVVPEAMACAVPCVVTDVGDLAYIVGNTGRVVPPRDPVKLAAALEELILMAASERLAVGQMARSRVLTQFSVQKLVSSYQEIYMNSAEIT